MVRDRKVSLPLSSLHLDFAIYPRVSVDDAHVSKLVKALEAGKTLPLPVADSKSKRVADGFHRHRAYQRVLGPEGVIDVLLRDYVNEDELLLDAIEMNATHGKSLDSIDYIHCVRMCEERGIDLPRIAVAIHRTMPEVQKLAIRIAQVPPGSPDIIPGTVATVALKRPLLWLQGTTFTEQQAEALPTAPGTSYSLLVRQLLDALRCGFINRQDETLQQALCELRDVLIEYCK